MMADLPVGTVQYPPTSERPAGYPADLPFVPGVGCVVASMPVPVGGPVRTCIWSVEGDEEMRAHRERMRAASELSESLSIHPQIMQIEERVAKLPPPEVARLSRDMDELLATAPAEDRDLLAEIHDLHMQSMQPTPQMASAIEHVTGTVVAESVADGWEVVNDQPRPFPPGSRTVELRRPGSRRLISATAAGHGGNLTLMETPVRDE